MTFASSKTQIADPMPGTNPADKVVDALRQHHREHPGDHCYLVIDPSLRILEDRPDDGVFFSRMTAHPVPIEHGAFPSEHRPKLLEIDLSDPLGVALLREAVRIAFADRNPAELARGHGQRVGGWLFSGAPIDDIVAHWSAVLLQRDERGQQRVLRFYDSRALSLMWPVLDAQQQRTLLGPVQAWFALDASANLVTYTAKGAMQPRLDLSDDQWRVLHRQSHVNRALSLFMHDVDRQPSESEVAAAQVAAARADYLGLSDRDDIVKFVGYALSWHPKFYEHPVVDAAFKALAKDALHCAVVDEFDAGLIDDVQSGRWLKQTA
ncbi:hypothetical protein AWB75_06017 [Caballeronia catudaia]|uniref:DUF4123 domain-containing protein n=1 Tax=Caballeronia catudaia TaxID=1777136 RepID=A0A158D2K3_9BURK|nr:DUF4123 domain-containing protein [Caballeronia catudaia]SAK88057.1 hypothetical protein AWB75_06017 [Caballeronia catudaia]